MLQIEPVAFYPSKHKKVRKMDLIGSITVRLNPIGIEIKYVEVFIKQEGLSGQEEFFFALPRKIQRLENGKIAFVEYIKFTDKDQHDTFKKDIFNACEKYMLELTPQGTLR